jgi:hypothetical protein
VINKYLGYKISCELLHFEHNIDTHVNLCSIIPFFTELTPENEERKNEWEINRKYLYLGSPEHFLLSLRNNKLKEGKYKVYHVTGIGTEDQELIKEVTGWEDIKTGKQILGNPALFFQKYLRIEYNKSEYSHVYQRYSYFTIDSNGIADNHLPFICFGFWSKIGVANILPRNYMPEETQDK